MGPRTAAAGRRSNVHVQILGILLDFRYIPGENGRWKSPFRFHSCRNLEWCSEARIRSARLRFQVPTLCSCPISLVDGKKSGLSGFDCMKLRRRPTLGASLFGPRSARVCWGTSLSIACGHFCQSIQWPRPIRPRALPCEEELCQPRRDQRLARLPQRTKGNRRRSLRSSLFFISTGPMRSLRRNNQAGMAAV